MRSKDSVHNGSASGNGKASGLPSRPRPLPVDPEGIPDALKTLWSWVTWRYVEEVDPETGEVDWGKPPRNARTGRLASSTNPKTWSTFADALAAYQGGDLDGLGLVLHRDKVEGKEEAGGLVGVDLDHCRDPATGEIAGWAAAVVRDLDTYAEVSPSGAGVRLFLYGDLPPHGRKRGDYENYQSGRYVTVTGQRVPGTPDAVEYRQEQLSRVHARFFGEKAGPRPGAPRPAGVPPAGPADAELIRLAEAAKNGAKFSRLWRGDLAGHGSASEADLALCNYLAFWCGPDPDRIADLFSQSGLYRTKWNREDYRKRTIDKALAGRTEFYEPPARPHQGNGAAFARGNETASGPDGGGRVPGPAAKVFSVGPISLAGGDARQTAAGKLIVPVAVLKGGRVIDQFSLNNSAWGRKQAEAFVAINLEEDSADRKGVAAALAALVAHAIDGLRSRRERPRGRTVQEVVAAEAPKEYRLGFRTDKGTAWSEAQARFLNRADFCSGVSSRLMEAASAASDVTRDADGRADRVDVVRRLRVELEVLWADLMSSLPLAPDAELGEDSTAARRFAEAMVRLWTATRTWETPKAGDPNGAHVGASRASLISRVKGKRKEGKSAAGWSAILPAVAAWWRLITDERGEEWIALAMRSELPHQIGVELPGVTDQTSLIRLGVRYHILTSDSAFPARLTGGTRLAVLSLGWTKELLDEPDQEDEKAAPTPQRPRQ